MSFAPLSRDSELERILEPEVMDTDEEADGYQAMDHSGPNNAFVDRLIELGAKGHMLDIGCGPGSIPILIAERIPDAYVTGVDLSPKMLAHAERAKQSSPAAERITFELADAKGLPFEDRSFDVVCSNTILHHIPDPTFLLLEASRLVRPGGVLLIRDLYRPIHAEELARLVATYAKDDTPYNRELFRASLHAALTIDELADIAVDADLGEADLVVDTDRHMSLQMHCRD